MLGVEFDREDRTYFPGELIRCRWHLKLSSQKSFQGIYVRFLGKATVRWTEESGSGDNKTSTSYYAHEEYFKVYIPLCESKGKLKGNNICYKRFFNDQTIKIHKNLKCCINL